MIRNGAVGVVGVVLLVSLLLVGSASAFLAGYGYYQDVTINNAGASNLTNYQMMFTVNTSSGTSTGTTIYLNSHANASLNDLRFTSTGDTVYDYWIESAASPYNVWVEVPSIPTGNSTMRVQYGNAAAAAVSNGTATFPFFDDFSGGSLDGAKWTASAGVAVADGICTITRGGAAAYIYGKTNFDNTYSLRTRVKTTNTHCWYGIESHAATWESSYMDVVMQTNIYIGSGSGYCDGGAHGVNRTAYHITDIVRSGGTVTKVYINGVEKASSTTCKSTTTRHPIYHAFAASSVFYVDWVFYHNYTATLPTAPAWSGESTTSAAPVAAFSGIPTSGNPPLNVTFTDASTNTPLEWLWRYSKNGGAWTQFSTDQNPSYAFGVGTYSINLTATNLDGTDDEVKIDYISVTYTFAKFPGCADYPADLDADGLYEDINGNGRKDWADIIMFFNNCDWARVNQPQPAFDWNGNGIIDFADVFALYAIGVP